MSVFTGDEGALIIQPEGDILFTTSRDPGEDGRVELILAKPGPVYVPGELDPDKAEKTTGEIGTVLRLRLTLPSAIVLQEALAAVLINLAGMPSREPAKIDNVV